jgi:hypothetical protein
MGSSTTTSKIGCRAPSRRPPAPKGGNLHALWSTRRGHQRAPADQRPARNSTTRTPPRDDRPCSPSSLTATRSSADGRRTSQSSRRAQETRPSRPRSAQVGPHGHRRPCRNTSGVPAGRPTALTSTGWRPSRDARRRRAVQSRTQTDLDRTAPGHPDLPNPLATLQVPPPPPPAGDRATEARRRCCHDSRGRRPGTRTPVARERHRPEETPTALREWGPLPPRRKAGGSGGEEVDGEGP